MTKGEKIAESNRRRRGETRQRHFSIEFICRHCQKVGVATSEKRMYCSLECKKAFNEGSMKAVSYTHLTLPTN